MNKQQLIFSREYVVDFNATQAAIRAGYSSNSAHVIGSRLLKNLDIQTEIEVHKKSQAIRADVQVDEIVRGLREIADDEFSPTASRVMAWRSLAEYKGMFKNNQSVELGGPSLELLGLLRERAKLGHPDIKPKQSLPAPAAPPPPKPPAPVLVPVDRSVVRENGVEVNVRGRGYAVKSE